MENENDKNEIITEEGAAVPTNVSTTKKTKRDFYVELALFFILGILVGIVIKTEAVKTITMGFEDYKMKIEKQDYSINKIQAELAAEAEQEAVAAEQQQEQDSGEEKM